MSKKSKAAKAATKSNAKGVKSAAVEIQGIQYAISDYSFVSSPDGKSFFVIGGTDAAPEIVEYDLTLGITFELKASYLVIYSGDEGPLGADPVISYNSMALSSTYKGASFSSGTLTLSFTGVGVSEFITADPINFTYISAPFLKNLNIEHEGEEKEATVGRVYFQYLSEINGNNTPQWLIKIYFDLVTEEA